MQAGSANPRTGSVDATLSVRHFDSDESIISFVDSLYDESKRQKWPFERQWFININFYIGRQYIIPNDRTRRFEVPEDRPHRVRHVANKIRPFVTTKISKLTREVPVPEVQSATADYSDFQKAKLCDALMEFWYHDLNLSDKLVSEAVLWLCVTGNVFLRPFWNKSRGRRIMFSKDQLPVDLWQELVSALYKQGATDDEIASLDQVGSSEGDVDLEVLSPFSVWVHPNVKHMREALWVLETGVKDMDSLRETWGDVTGVSPDEDGDWRDYEGRLMGNDLSSSPFIDNKRADFPKVIEKQLWIRPCRLFPSGKYVVVAGGKVLHKGDFPYRHGRLPFIHIKDVHVPGRFWGRCEIEDLIPVQKQINAKASRISEIFNLHVNPKWLVPRGSGIDKDDLTNAADEVVEYNPGQPPVAHIPPPLPGYTADAIERDLRDFDDISGQREATRGEAPGRVDSASAIMALQEADDSRLGPLNKHLYSQLAEAFSQMLSLAHEFYTEVRLIRIVGDSGRVEVREFSGKDLALGGGFSDRFDVRIAIGSGLPLSRSARAQFALMLVDRGVLNMADEKQREAFLRIIEIGGPKSVLFNSMEEARAQANIENADMANGVVHSVNSWDIHSAHIECHKSYMRRPHFFIEAQNNPSLIQIFERHIAQHENFAAFEAQRQAALGAIASGQLPVVGPSPQAVTPPPPEAQQSQAAS